MKQIEGILENYEILGYVANKPDKVNQAKLFIRPEVDGELSDKVLEVFSMTSLTREVLVRAKGGYVLYEEQPDKRHASIRQSVAFEGTPIHIRGISYADTKQLNPEYHAKFLTKLHNINHM